MGWVEREWGREKEGGRDGGGEFAGVGSVPGQTPAQRLPFQFGPPSLHSFWPFPFGPRFFSSFSPKKKAIF